MVTEPSSEAFSRPSPPSSMTTEMVGGVESLVVVSVACVAELPARSETSALIVRLASSRLERSRPVTE